jgi:hypothetical protein
MPAKTPELMELSPRDEQSRIKESDDSHRGSLQIHDSEQLLSVDDFQFLKNFQIEG